MDNSSKNTNIILGILAVVVLAFVFIFSSGAVDMGVTSGLISGGESGGSAGITAFLRQISAVKSITLDTSVFDHPVLQELDDRSIPLTDENMGRSNPFAPFRETRTVVSNPVPETPAPAPAPETPRRVLSD